MGHPHRAGSRDQVRFLSAHLHPFHPPPISPRSSSQSNTCRPALITTSRDHSAWQGYSTNNYTNDYSTDPLFDGSAQSGNVSLEFGNGIQTAGLVQITVCPLSSLIRADTRLVGTIPNITAFAASPCPATAYFDCTVLPCDGVD